MRWAKTEGAEIHPVTANALPTSVIVILSDGEAGVEGSVIPPKEETDSSASRPSAALLRMTQ